jgi:hypothetical protein
MNLECRMLNLPTLIVCTWLGVSKAAKVCFRKLIVKQGYSEKIADELWKWYDFSEKKGVASF